MSDVDHGTAPAPAGSGLGPDERAELERLRAERARRKRRYFSWRPTVALAALIFVFWGQPTAIVVIALVVLLPVVIELIELIGARPPAQSGMAGSL